MSSYAENVQANAVKRIAEALERIAKVLEEQTKIGGAFNK